MELLAARRFEESGCGFDIDLGTPLKLIHLDKLIDLVGNPLPTCLLYTSPSPRDATLSRMPSSA